MRAQSIYPYASSLSGDAIPGQTRLSHILFATKTIKLAAGINKNRAILFGFQKVTEV
jgi:hypothetical protein